MDIHNPTPILLAAVPQRVRYPDETLTLIAKGTFDLAPGGMAAPAEEPLPFDDDIEIETEVGKVVVYPSDFVPAKPRTDLLASACVYTPGGRPARECAARFQVGEHAVEFVAVGERRWQGPLGRFASTAEPFERMRVCWENAYGGRRSRSNPVGMGRDRKNDEDGARSRPLPTIETPDGRVSRRGSRPDALALTPLPRDAKERAKQLGRYGRSWQRTRSPWLPDDLDPSYWSAAAAPLRYPAFLKGDEPLCLDNLHPEHARYECRLPGLRVRCFLLRDPLESDDAEPSADHARPEPIHEEVEMRLDTLWVDPDAGKLVLVWRGQAVIASPDHADVHIAQLGVEPMESEPLPRASYEAQLQPPPPAEAAQEPEQQAEPEPGEEEQAADAAVLAQLKTAAEALAKGGAPASLVAAVQGGLAHPDAIFDELLAWKPVDAQAAAEHEARQVKRLAEILEANGEDPALAQEMLGLGEAGEEEEDGGFTREVVEARAAGGESLAGAPLAGLDLSGLDLSDADLERADLTGANLSGARLEGANLEGAMLEGANLSGIEARRVRLAGADLAHADLSGAFIVAANLESANLVGAKLDNATARRVQLRFAQLADASLVGFDGKGLQACPAVFDRAVLDDADFAGARFENASFIGVTASGASFDAAKLAGARLSDGARLEACRLTDVRAAESTWVGSELVGCDMTGARLPRSNFEKVRISGGLFEAAELKGASFAGARVQDSGFEDANLFQVRFTLARLQDCRFAGANLYAADFRDGELEDVDFADANLELAAFDPKRRSEAEGEEG